MDSIELPGWLGDIIGGLAGQVWPKEMEGDFAAAGEVWDVTGQQLDSLVADLGFAKYAMLAGLDGPTGAQFGSFMENLATALPQMSQGTSALSQLAMETALNVQYAKLMMITQMAVTAATIAELASSLFGSAAIPAVEAAAEAVAKSIASQLIKQILKAAAEAAALGAGMDAGIQLFQYLKYGKPWNWQQTGEAAGLGALGGALGGAMGAGAIKLLGEDVGNSLISHMVQGAINGAVVTEIGNAINGGDASVGLGASAGAFGGAVGHAVASHAGDSTKIDDNLGDVDFKPPVIDGGDVNGNLGGSKGESKNGSGSSSVDNGSVNGGLTNGASVEDGSVDGGAVGNGSVGGGAVNNGSFHGDGSTSGVGETDGGQTTGGYSGDDGTRRSVPAFSSADPVGDESHTSIGTVSPEPDNAGIRTQSGEGDYAPSVVGHDSSGEGDLTQGSNDAASGVAQHLTAPSTTPSTTSGDRDSFDTPAPSTATTGSGYAIAHEAGGNLGDAAIYSQHAGDVQGLPGFEPVTRQLVSQTTDHPVAQEPTPVPSASAPREVPAESGSGRVVSSGGRFDTPVPLERVSSEPGVLDGSGVPRVEYQTAAVDHGSGLSGSEVVPARPEALAAARPGSGSAVHEPSVPAVSHDEVRAVAPVADASHGVDQVVDGRAVGGQSGGAVPVGAHSVADGRPTASEPDVPDTAGTEPATQVPPIRASEPSAGTATALRPARESSGPSASDGAGSGDRAEPSHQLASLAGVDGEHGSVRLGADSGHPTGAHDSGHGMRSDADTPPVAAAPSQHAGGSGHAVGAMGVHLEALPFSEHAPRNSPSRIEQWEDAKAEIQQHFTDRFDYTVKTERVADVAEQNFQSAMTDSAVLHGRGDPDGVDLSPASRDDVLDAFQTDVKAAFDEQFGTPGDRYDTAVDHAAEFGARLDGLSSELPARIAREALWVRQHDVMRERFDRSFDAQPVVAARKELFGPQGDGLIAARRDEAWQRLEPELRKAFDETAARTSPADLASAVSARFDDMMHDEVPKGIALHDQLLTEVSALRPATGEQYADEDVVRQRITSEFESVFGKPFAPARPDDGGPDEDGPSASDRWDQYKQNHALIRELSTNLDARFAEAVGSRAAGHAGLGMYHERPTENTDHGLTYNVRVGADGRLWVEREVDTDHPIATAPTPKAEWLPGRDLSDTGLERVKSAFADDVVAAYREHFGRSFTGDDHLDAGWQSKLDDLYTRRLPGRLDYQAEYERHLRTASQDFEDSYDRWSDDVVAGGHLDDAGLERVRTEFGEDFRAAYDEAHFAGWDSWQKAGGAAGARDLADEWDRWQVGGTERSWQTVYAKLLAGLGRHFAFERELGDAVGGAAGRFDSLGREFQVENGHRQELGSAYRTDTATRFDRIFGDQDRDLTAWLDHEKEHGDTFGSRLTALRDEREAAAAAARAEAEHATAAAQASQSAESSGGADGAGHHDEEGGQQPQEVHEEPQPEAGLEKLQRLSAENNEKLVGDAQQLAQIWRQKGHSDAVIEQATKSWTDAVRKEFDFFHHGTAENDHAPQTRGWQEEYDKILGAGKSERWVALHEQIGRAMSALEDGLSRRTEEWSGSRFTDWQRQQLADAGRRLTSEVRRELDNELRTQQARGGGQPPMSSLERKWVAEGVTKPFDDVLGSLRRELDTSPALMATLTKLRAETVSALGTSGHAVQMHDELTTDVGGQADAGQWQHVRTQLDAEYAGRLSALAVAEKHRPDANAIFTRTVNAARDQRYAGVEQYEKLLPDATQFRQALDKTFDQTFKPPGPDGRRELGSTRWDDESQRLINTLASEVKLASLRFQLAKEAAHTAQTTRDAWISEHAADEKVISQVLGDFRTRQQQLFLGTYGYLNEFTGEIDVNASHRYEDTYPSLVRNLDAQLTAASARRSAETAAAARYDDAVNAWRERHGSAVSSLEPGTTGDAADTQTSDTPETQTSGAGHDAAQVAAEQNPQVVESAQDPASRLHAAFADEAAKASSLHQLQLRAETIGVEHPAWGALDKRLEMADAFDEAMPRLQAGITEAALRNPDGFGEHFALSLVQPSIARAHAVFQQAVRRAQETAGPERNLRQDLEDVIGGTKAVAEFGQVVYEHVNTFAANSAEPIPEEAVRLVFQRALNSASDLLDKLVASAQRYAGEWHTVLSRNLHEMLTEIDDRLAFETGAHRAISSASKQALHQAQEELFASHTVLDADSVQRLRLQHLTADAAETARSDLAAHHFDPVRTQQAIEELDDTLHGLAGEVRNQVAVESKLTSALVEAGKSFAVLADAHAVPAPRLAKAEQDYRRDWMAAYTRIFVAEPVNLQPWLEHERKTADRFGAAAHAPVHKAEVESQLTGEDAWRKSTFSPDGDDAACVEAVLLHARWRRSRSSSTPRPVRSRTRRMTLRDGPAGGHLPVHRPVPPSLVKISAWTPHDARRERIECEMSGILESVETVFVDGMDVPVKHKYADRMVVLRGAGEQDGASLYYTADEWQAFLLGVKEGEFDDMGAAGTPVSDGGKRVVALRDSKDRGGPMLILTTDAWVQLLIAIKANERELPSDMRETLDERFH